MGTIILGELTSQPKVRLTMSFTCELPDSRIVAAAAPRHPQKPFQNHNRIFFTVAQVT